MFRKTSAQSFMFEIQNYFPGALPKNDWSYTYRKRVLPLINEEKFKDLYSESERRPNASIRNIVSRSNNNKNIRKIAPISITVILSKWCLR